MIKTELSPIIVKPYSADKYEVVEPYPFKLSIVESEIREGYTTDGASIPRLFWWIYPKCRPEYFTACVVHDWLCSRAMHAESIKAAYEIADKAFYEAMIKTGVNNKTAWIFFSYVKIRHKIKCFLKGWR